jgi:dTDP-4-amino-4,6-dideoxygalactose transaminase
MDEIAAVAGRYGLVVIEDAAQAHGATYRGRRTGSLGRIATFSLNVSKNLPTCGEGGLVTTGDPALAEQVAIRRQFGELTPSRGQRTYVSRELGFNDKLSALQAAFTLSQLERFDEYGEHRRRNVAALHERLRQLPGIVVPEATEHATHVWHILRYRFDPVALGYPDVAPGRLCNALRRVLVAEGVPVAPYQIVPLPGQEVFRRTVDRDPLLVAAGAGPYTMDDFPVSRAVIEDSLTLSRVHLPPDSGPRLARYADAFEKVWQHLDVVVQYARGLPYRPPWETAAEVPVAAGRVS